METITIRTGTWPIAVVSFLISVLAPFVIFADGVLPGGLFQDDPMVRFLAVQQVASRRDVRAEAKLVDLVKNDPHAQVREAACRALATIGAVKQIDMLTTVALTDANAGVRTAATEAVRMLKGEGAAISDGAVLPGVFEKDSPSDVEPENSSVFYDEKHGQPSLEYARHEPVTRLLAVGLGTMGGYGIASLTIRGRIPTGVSGLPWIGLEAGGGWTPPGGFQITAGPVDDMSEENRWKIVATAGAVLFYLHREHYIAGRGGYEVGRGGFAVLGYGFEHLNEEGFFSWGIELGVLLQPVIEDRIDVLVDCNDSAKCSDQELWPLIPFGRFSMHFYLI
jgi:HEAT repeat protein